MRKEKMYYKRTYRHLKPSSYKNVLFVLCVICPILLLITLNLWNITYFISDLGVKMLGKVFSGIPLYILTEEFSISGKFAYIDMPTEYPTLPMVFISLIISLGILTFFITGKRKIKALSIYFMLSLLVHIISCVFFIFATNHFPYTVKDYSNLYMQQQIGIWITFVILIGVVTGFEGNRGYFYKIITVVVSMLYSFIFGSVRYIVFLFALHQLSVLYMPMMFFVLGPMFDFVYLVFIYSFFINKMVDFYESGEGQEDWLWA